MKRRTLVVEVYSAEALTNSASGNPRWTLHTSKGAFTTLTDTTCAWGVQNLMRLPTLSRKRITIVVDRRDRVVDILTQEGTRP